MKGSTGLKLALATACGGLAYARFGRPWVQNWGATRDEIERAMPGDDILPDAWLQTTRAITIEAPPGAVWPWLLQMGPRPRAGAYTYDWVERLLGINIENSDRILPEFQHLEPGEFMALNQKGDGVRVIALEPERSLLFQWEPANTTWLFALSPEGDGKTRLVSRNRMPDVTSSAPVARLLWRALMVAFMEPGSLVMERKMLFGIKDRAEKLHRESGGTSRIEAEAAALAGDS